MLPNFIAPMLPTLVEGPPDGDKWIHEIKHDGYRTQLQTSAGGGRAFTRNGHDWTDRFQCVVNAGDMLIGKPAVLDGEIVVQDEHGRSDFHALQGCIGRFPERLVFFAFDLLWFDGTDLRREPLGDRRARLRDLLERRPEDCCVQYSDDISDGKALLAAVEGMKLEGIVSKKATSRYSSGRSLSWLKTKIFAEDEMVVVGHKVGEGPSIALLAREKEGGGLEMAGGAFITLSKRDRELFWSRARELEVDRPFLRGEKKAGATWLKPEMRVKVKHLRGERKLRHASLLEVIS